MGGKDGDALWILVMNWESHKISWAGKKARSDNLDDLNTALQWKNLFANAHTSHEGDEHRHSCLQWDMHIKRNEATSLDVI